MEQKRINIFISHRWKNYQNYQDMVNLLEKYDVVIGDFSVPPKKSLGDNLPSLELERKLKNRIKNCSIFIVVTNIDLIDSEWVQMEILFACKYDKYILAVRPKGQKKLIDPEYIKIATRRKGKIINYDPIRILKTIQTVTNVKIKSLDDRSRKLTKQQSSKKRKKQFKLGLYVLAAFIFGVLFMITIHYIQRGSYQTLGYQNISDLGRFQIINQYDEIIVVQKLVSLDSALHLKKKYSKRNFEVIQAEDVSPDSMYFLSIIDLKNRSFAEKNRNKIKSKKLIWRTAKIIPLQQICPYGIEKIDSIYKCR